MTWDEHKDDEDAQRHAEADANGERCDGCKRERLWALTLCSDCADQHDALRATIAAATSHLEKASAVLAETSEPCSAHEELTAALRALKGVGR